MNTVEYIYRDMKELLETIVIKYDRLAKDNETVESRRSSDRYISAKLELDTFNSHTKFSKDAIRNCGVFDEDLVEQYHTNKKSMPDYIRNKVLKEERFLIIENYDEQNNYYRELSGKPNTDDFDPIFLPLDVCRKYGLNSRIPVHEYRDDEIYKIERTVIPELIKEYPNKGYLKYLGTNKVDLVTARRAKNFEIIRAKMTQNTVFLNKFFETYIGCREYFTSVIYIKEFSGKYDLYDNFIAMHIMLMTVQRMMINTFKIGVDRDFYDLPSIKALFDSYGLPFFEELPLDYQRSIMKNLNMLLRYKSTDKVLYDISNILFFDRIKIFKYFLMKEREFDKQGNPIFAYKEIIDEDGNVEVVEDVEKMYSFYFQSTDILERNTALALENSHNKLSYDEITENDMFWWNDEDVQKVLYEQEFNYVETKYLSVNVMYRLTETMFESIYALNMLVDKKESCTESIYIDLPRITLNKISVFDSVIMLFALTSKKCGMKGNIISSPTQILSVLGFNFKANFEEIIAQVYANKSQLPPEIVQYLINIDITSAKDINDMYSNIRWLADFLTDRINTTTSIKEYRACKDLYEVLMIKEYTTDILKKKDGSVATTYLDYLNDQSPRLGEFIENCPKEKTDVYIKHIIGKINELIPDLEHMSTLEGSDNVLIKALMKLIEFFKSYTVDLNSLNVLYVMDSKYHNMIRMVHDINHMSKIIHNNERNFREYFDTIATHIKLGGRDQLEYLHRCFASKDALFKYLHEIIDTEYINKTLGLTSNIPQLTDKDRAEIMKIIASQDKVDLSYTQEYHINIDEKDKCTMKDLIHEIVTNIFIQESGMMNLYNDVVEITCKDGYKFNINLDEFTAYFAKLYIDIYLPFDEKFTLASIVDVKDFMVEDYIDIINVDSTMEARNMIQTSDKGLPTITISREDGWFDGVVTKIQDYQVLAKLRAMVQATNIIEAFNSMSIQYNISPKEWVDISNKFDIVEKGYKGIEYWYDVQFDAKLIIFDDYSDILNSIKIMSVSSNIKASDMCKMYIKLTRTDNLPLIERFKYNVCSVLRSRAKGVDILSIQKAIGGKTIVTPQELIKVYRTIHRQDKPTIKELYGLDVDVAPKLKLLNKYKTYFDKKVNVQTQKIITDVMKVYLRHNLESLMKLETKIRTDKDMSSTFRLLDIYNGYLLSIISIMRVSDDNIPLKDANPITIIRHNFTEIQKFDFKILSHTVSASVCDAIFEGYYQALSEIDKIVNLEDNGSLITVEMCRHAESIIYEYLDKLNSDIELIVGKMLYKDSDLKMIRELLQVFSKMCYYDRPKIVDKLQMIHVNIDIAYLAINNDKIKHLDSIAYANEISLALLFNRVLVKNIISLAGDFNLSHEISVMYKDFFNEFFINVKEEYSLTDILYSNETLSVIYSEFLNIKKTSNIHDKTNIEDRIKVFYE